jgi:short-subunit dehydrogenase
MYTQATGPSRQGAPLVFITGASSGIGQALARRYYSAGCSIALVARRADEMHRWTSQAGWSRERFAIYGADVSDTDQAVQAGLDCVKAQGLPDIVIASAGISRGMDSSQRADLDVMRRVHATNLLGMAATFQPFLAPFVHRGNGTLVGIASVAGVRGLPGHGAYCSSKAAVISYCESLRSEMAAATGHNGVKVVVLCPGYIATPLTQRNPFPMPFLMSADEFAGRATRAIERGASYQVIPWQMSIVAKLLPVLPNRVFDRAMKGQPKKPRQSS